ncbi:MAG: ABC transporter substrate-binding protein [Candidatus Dormibacteraeota bacterium]|nr:ABC transporter substrate-binding protein [Candidatus Dormibacteraeota bacterium]
MSPRRGLIYGLMAALAAVACAPGATNNNQGSTTVHGGSVSVVGVWSGAELDSFNAVIAPFEQKTGIKVNFEGARDQDAILSTRVSAGNPPDLAAAPSPSLLTRFAQNGKVIDLGKVVDTNQLKQDYAKSWIDLGTVNGKLVQVFSWAALKGLVWYDPKVWSAKGYQVPKTWNDMITLQQKIKTDGTTPWCMAVESGGDTGWAGSDFHKEIALSQVGPDVYDKWWQGKQKWSSSEIKSSWTSFGQVLGPGSSNVYGGPSYVVNTNFGEVGNHMFSTPPGCYMLNQASFITDFFVKANSSLKPGVDFNFFALPDVNTKYAGSHVVAADAWSMFKDTPQARELLKYLITPEAQAIWVKRGGKLSPNKKVALSDYPDEQTKSIGQLLLDTKIGRYDAGDLMPSDMKHAYWSGILDFIKDPSKIDSILANLDKVQSTAYTAA